METSEALLAGGSEGYDDAEPGEDMPVAPDDDMTLVQYVMACKKESEDARWERDEHNRINYDVVHSRQDLSNKVEGQSSEFLPKISMAAEQLRAFIKNGLVAFGNWFQSDLTPDPEITTPPGQPVTVLGNSGIEKLLKHRLEDAEQIAPGCQDFPTVVSDAIYTGALASLMVLKVHGMHIPTRQLSVDLIPFDKAYTDPITGEAYTGVDYKEELSMREGRVWRLVVELIRPEDYFPDPTGRGLYEVHRTRTDLYKVIEMAEAGEYDLEAVEGLKDSFMEPEEEADEDRETNQSPSTPPNWRKEVVLDELWGNILDSEGKVIHRNVRCTIANERFVIRKPEPNPFWHQESPFVVDSLISIPFSVFHKALFDDAVRLNLAMNELFNLMLDGGLAAVWGNKQIHMSLIENADDFANGIGPAEVFIAKEEAPPGMELVKQIDSGTVPQESMGMYQLVDSEFERATKINSIQLGQLPKKDVRATEVAASEQSSSMFFDSMIADVERGLIVRALRLAWLTMLQNADDWKADDVVGCIGEQAAKNLAMMSPAKRYMTYGQGARFKVHGLSTVLGRAREFQKILALNGVITQSPILAQAFMQTASPLKMLHFLFKALNIDPEDVKITEEEAATLQQRMQELPMFGQGGGQGGGMGGGMAMEQMPQQQPENPMQGMQAGVNRMQQAPQEL